MSTNKTEGNRFERDFCEILSRNGFWVHNFQQNASGQPADVIAVKDGIASLIDCKVCSSKTFRLIRVEDNQHLAMTAWEQKGNGVGWFAIRIHGRVYMMAYPKICDFLRKGFSSLTERELDTYGYPLERWLGLNDED